MTEIVVFPDVEAAVVAYLKANRFNTVATQVPPDRPAQFIRVRRVGGQRINLVTDGAVLTVEAWASSEGTAARNAARAYALLHALPDVADAPAVVRRVVDVGGLTSYPDPETDSPRYTFTVRIDVKGTPETL